MTGPPPPGRAKLPEEALADPGVARRALLFAFVHSMAGLVLGLACMLLGAALLIHGVAGSTGWVVQLLGLNSSLSDAAPGVVLFVVGLLVVLVTNFDVSAAAGGGGGDAHAR